MLPVAIFIPGTEHFGEKAVCVSICLQGGEERGKGRGRSQQRWAGALGRKPGGPVGGSTGCVEAEEQQRVSLPGAGSSMPCGGVKTWQPAPVKELTQGADVARSEGVLMRVSADCVNKTCTSRIPWTRPGSL